MKALCSQGNSAPSLGKQSRLQKAKLGRDPARNGEKGNNSIVIHLMETYPTNRTFRNENSLYLLLSRAMSTENFSRLQGDRRTQTVPPSAPYRTTAGNPAVGRDGDTAHTILIPQTESFTPWGCSLWDTPHSSRGEFITKDHAHGKQLVRSVLTMILPSSFWLKKKQSMIKVGVEHRILPRNHAYTSRLERTDTLKIHFWDASVHPQTAPSSVAGCL